MLDEALAKPKPPRRRWGKILAISISAALALLAYLWFCIPPKIPNGPLRLTRGDRGQLVSADEKGSSGASFEAQYGAIQSNNGFTSSSVSSQSGHALFACNRLVILNRNDHLLMARVGQKLLDSLKTLGYLSQVDYYPCGFAPDPGQLAPDLTITLDMDKLVQNSGITGEDVEAEIGVSMYNGPPDCQNSYDDYLTPPVTTLDWHGRLHHTSTSRGLASSAAKYKLVAENIAKQIFDSLKKELEGRRAKEGVLPETPEMPSAFFPPYRQPPALPLADLGSLQTITSWHGFMNHCETLWRLEPNRPPAKILAEIQHRLQSAGWEGSSDSIKDQQPYLRMCHGAAVLTAYVPSPGWSLATTPQEPQTLDLHYVDRMTEKEIAAAIDAALAADVSNDVLVCFERSWSKTQSEQVLKRLSSKPARTPQISLTVANLYHRLGQDGKARAEVLRARALTSAVYDQSGLDSAIQELAKTLKDENLARSPIKLPVYKELGFIELKRGVTVPPQDVAVDEPINFFAKEKGDKLKIVSVCVVKDSPSGFALRITESLADGCRSSSTGGTTQSVSLSDLCGTLRRSEAG